MGLAYPSAGRFQCARRRFLNCFNEQLSSAAVFSECKQDEDKALDRMKSHNKIKHHSNELAWVEGSTHFDFYIFLFAYSLDQPHRNIELLSKKMTLRNSFYRRRKTNCVVKGCERGNHVQSCRNLNIRQIHQFRHKFLLCSYYLLHFLESSTSNAKMAVFLLCVGVKSHVKSLKKTKMLTESTKVYKHI